MKKIFAIVLACAMLFTVTACSSTSGSAETLEEAYPTKDIKVIVPKGAGGGTDTSARGLVQFLQTNLEGSNFVVTNKPDGGGVTGMVDLANSKADGYTLGMVTVELAMFPHQDKSPVTFADYKAISAPIAAPAALVVSADAPYDNVEEFVAYVKEKPDTVHVGNSGIGAIWHIAAMMFENSYDVSFKHIPYPNGSADIAAALAGKHIDATFADPSNFKSQIDAGELKVLGLMASERSELYPEVPTFKELGEDLTVRAWACLVAPRDIPDDILAQLREAALATTEDPEYKEYFSKQGIDPVSIVGDECQKMMEEDHNMYEEMLKSIQE